MHEKVNINISWLEFGKFMFIERLSGETKEDIDKVVIPYSFPQNTALSHFVYQL